HPRLAAARARAESGEVQATSTGRRMLPSIHLSDEAQYWNAPFSVSLGGGSLTVRDQKTNTFVAAGAQPLVGLLRQNDEQTAQAEQSAAQRAQVAAGESDLRATVETQFLRVFEAQALEQIAAASIRELGDQVTVAKARLQSGVITNADLLRIQVAVANAQQQALEARSQAQTARAQLFAAIGIAPGDAAELTLVEPTERLNAARNPKPVGTLGSLLPLAAQRRPELAQYAHLVSAAERQRRASGFALLPDIDFEAAYVRTDGQQFAPKNSAYVGLKANWAIWEWGATALQRKSAAIQAEAAQRDREMLERQIESELTASLAQGDAARGAVGSAGQAVASAEEAYRVTDAAVKAGTQTTTDLLQAQSELTQARLNLIRAQYELVLSDVALARATGR
ncbi:MAG TPA: TolC family protein, partial [Polyangia bacterium]|nr:TolC family protein [Polyangia bacterium]